MIQATIDGNVGSDPELRATASGKSVCSFSLASTMKVGNDKHTTWVDVTCWEETAEMVSERVRKGQRVLATGRMSVEEFTRKDGSKGSKLKLVADDVGVSLRWRPKAGAGVQGGSQSEVESDSEDSGDETIPF
jgi:single-strand DNA-binding protein